MTGPGNPPPHASDWTPPHASDCAPQPPGVLGQPSTADGQIARLGQMTELHTVTTLGEQLTGSDWHGVATLGWQTVTRETTGQVVRGMLTQAVTTEATGQVVRGTLGQFATTEATGQVTTGMDRTGQVVRGMLGQSATTDATGQVVMGTERTVPGLGTQLTAALASSLPCPQAVFGTGPVNASARAELSRQALIWAWVRPGFFWNIRAIVPVRCGAAIDVPPIPL